MRTSYQDRMCDLLDLSAPESEALRQSRQEQPLAPRMPVKRAPYDSLTVKQLAQYWAGNPNR